MWGLLAAFAALLAATNPSHSDLVASLSALTSKGLGKFAGKYLQEFFLVCGFYVFAASLAATQPSCNDLVDSVPAPSDRAWANLQQVKP